MRPYAAIVWLLIAGSQAPAAEFAAMRENMVNSQIEERGITNAAVLAALRKVPRHEFVPDAERAHAYSDHPLPIGSGQTIAMNGNATTVAAINAPNADFSITGNGEVWGSVVARNIRPRRCP